MAYATMSVIAKHFKTNSFGYDTSEILMYCEAMIGDDDPTSAFHLMEGIGITEEELFAMSSDNK